MNNIEIINSDELPAGFMLFCDNCGHNISTHKDIEQPRSTESINTICSYDNGYYNCDCIGFKSGKITKILDTGQRNENLAVVEDKGFTRE